MQLIREYLTVWAFMRVIQRVLITALGESHTVETWEEAYGCISHILALIWIFNIIGSYCVALVANCNKESAFRMPSAWLCAAHAGASAICAINCMDALLMLIQHVAFGSKGGDSPTPIDTATDFYRDHILQAISISCFLIGFELIGCFDNLYP